MLTIGLGPAFASGGGGGGGTTPDIFGLDFVTTTVEAKVTDKSITEFPLVDTSKVTSMNQMFYNCTKLEAVPLLNTAKVTNMSSVFSGCTKLKSVPKLNTSNVTNMGSMFYGCSALETVPELDIPNVTNISNMFGGCTKLKNLPFKVLPKVISCTGAFLNCSSLEGELELDLPNITGTNNLFNNTRFRSIKLLNTSKVTQVESMCNRCSELESFEMDVSKASSDYYWGSVFAGCSKLANLKLYGFCSTYNFSGSPLLTKESVLYLFNNAQTVSGKKITLHADVFAQLTEDEIAIATEKGFSVVSA